MTPQQYEHMSSLMAVCRTFLNHMQYCMKNEGLIEKRFDLQLNVCTSKEGGTSFCRITLAQDVKAVGENEQYKNKMIQWKDVDGEWRIEYDPFAEEGVIQGMAQSGKTDVKEGMGKTASKPYPLDGLWLSSFDYDPVLDGGQ